MDCKQNHRQWNKRLQEASSGSACKERQETREPDETEKDVSSEQANYLFPEQTQRREPKFNSEHRKNQDQLFPSLRRISAVTSNAPASGQGREEESFDNKSLTWKGRRYQSDPGARLRAHLQWREPLERRGVLEEQAEGVETAEGILQVFQADVHLQYKEERNREKTAIERSKERAGGGDKALLSRSHPESGHPAGKYFAWFEG